MQHHRKFSAIGLLCLLLVCVLSFGCANKPAEPAGEPDQTGATTYRIDYGEKKGAFVDAPDACAEGEKVVLKTYMVMDATPTVTVDGERLSPMMTEDSMYLAYTFIMPDHDVKVDYVLGGSDMERVGCRIEYEGDATRVIDPVYDAYPGETVTLKMGLIFDVSTDVFVDGEAAFEVDGPDLGYLYYAFTMPDHDVVVTIESHNLSTE